MEEKQQTIVWFRRDLRVEDNPALQAAIERGGTVVPFFCWAPGEEGEWAPGAASRWWLHHALRDLGERLREAGSRLIVRSTSGQEGVAAVLGKLCRETGATAVFWNRRYEPAAIRRDTALKAELRREGLEVASFNGSLLQEPAEVANKSGRPFQVFTPFWKHCLTLAVPRPVRVDLAQLRPPGRWPQGEKLADLGLLPSISWDSGFHAFWGVPSRTSMLERLHHFIAHGAEAYPDARDLPAQDGTSRLSPALHFGQVGPREAWHALAGASNHSQAFETGIMRQLVWREFAHHLLYHFKETPTQPLREEFALFPWDSSRELVRAWQKGETGYPIVDAGMRQLWQTGWMHNRVRMIVGSLLVKHLLQHWLEGARWFWDTLVDADLANNTLGWQWIGGCGADAAPYFRIFNPITQGEKFDPGGDYVKRYVPELARLPASHVHKPWELGELDLRSAGVRLGRDYPRPIIGHAEGRARALKAFEQLKKRREER